MIQNIISSAESLPSVSDQMMLERVDVSDKLIGLIRQFASGLPESGELALEAPLRDAGLTSIGAVKLMLAIEAEYNLTIPDAELTPENFATIRAIEAMIGRLRAG